MTSAVSIIIPTHNESKYISDCLATIKELIDFDVEIIVVDNGSTDNTVELVKKYHTQIISLPAKTFPSIARNIGVKNSSGKYLAFIDADIVIKKKWAESLKKLVSTTTDVEESFFIGSPYGLSRTPGWIENYWFAPFSEKLEGFLYGGNMITTRKAFDQLGGFDEKLETGEDVDLCNRAKAEGISVKNDFNWPVYHEGFPKTLGHFIRREAWHGKGDLVNLKTFFQSKVALASSIFLLLHIAVLLFAFSFIVIDSYVFLGLLLISVSLIVVLSILRAINDMKLDGPGKLFFCTLISYFYFVGRCLSFWRVLRNT